MEKFDLVYSVLNDLQDAGVLRHMILIGSWCLELYRYQFGNPIEIPAVRTNDADMLVPRRLKLADTVDVTAIMEKNGFIAKHDYMTGLIKFFHQDLNFEFLTEPGAKPEEGLLRIKKLNIVAQELRFMSIPIQYHYPVRYKKLTVNVPEPEAFALHKLITGVC